MSDQSTLTANVPAKRPRNAIESKNALFESAQYLFNQHGFERSTIRAIGNRAGVDPALIARYFGSKGELYIAVLAAESNDNEVPTSTNDVGDAFEQVKFIVLRLLTRADQNGPGPILRSLISLDTTESTLEIAKTNLTEKLVDPLASALFTKDVDRRSLRAALAVSSLMGVTLSRSLGWFDEIQSAGVDDLVDLVTDLLFSLVDEDHEAVHPTFE